MRVDRARIYIINRNQSGRGTHKISMSARVGGEARGKAAATEKNSLLLLTVTEREREKIFAPAAVTETSRQQIEERRD